VHVISRLTFGAVLEDVVDNGIRPEVRFAPDSPLEEAGFEPSVPLRNQGTLRLHSEQFDPMIATHNDPLVKTTGGSDQTNVQSGNRESGAIAKGLGNWPDP
jgi:hypothetical protein